MADKKPTPISDQAAEDLEALEIPIEALDAVDLSIDPGLELEVVAANHMQSLENWTTLGIAVKAARSVKDHQKAETLSKDWLQTQHALAWMQYKWPACVALSKELQKFKGEQVKLNRAKTAESR